MFSVIVTVLLIQLSVIQKLTDIQMGTQNYRVYSVSSMTFLSLLIWLTFRDIRAYLAMKWQTEKQKRRHAYDFCGTNVCTQ